MCSLSLVDIPDISYSDARRQSTVTERKVLVTGSMKNNSERKIFQSNKMPQTRLLCLRNAILLTRNWRLPLQYRMCPVSNNSVTSGSPCVSLAGGEGGHLAANSGRPKSDFSDRLLSAHENAAVLPHNWPWRLPFSSINHPTARFCTVLRSWPGSQDCVWPLNSLMSWTLPWYVWSLLYIIVRMKLPSKTSYRRKDKGGDGSGKKTRKKT